MRRMKAAILSLALALMLFVNVALYKPSDHEYVSESPTESSQMIPPADDVATLAPPPKPIKPYTPPVVKTDVKTVKAVVATETMPKQTEKPIYKRQKETKQRKINVEATFYTAKCKGCSGYTASGYDVRKTVYYGKYRIIALSKDIPLGTIVNVTLTNGNTFDAIVLDRGGAIKRGKADILVASYDEAIRLGRQKATVTILKLGGR